ncbi:uncharacterized protein EV422DRAFT_549003 [Fimicolochytrium jonesii]|uniref:uncharacterized protein n=1 Tax=Fimicolochytrium jonesii TaxID=1396493 RepID=UPI0022FEFB47|nr:uncharacterized protein EV422DRAFT_549003 [Fimicolochytrium jonesii]KAI8815579.1 hypothetical protein EV422DRAFT_549003 [Fimicolochytrium jonesii]
MPPKKQAYFYDSGGEEDEEDGRNNIGEPKETAVAPAAVVFDQAHTDSHSPNQHAETTTLPQEEEHIPEAPAVKKTHPFSTRNVRYILLPPHTLLPLHLYIRARHLPWFDDAIFHELLAALTRVLPKKLAVEALARKEREQGLADVYRSPGVFQMAYCLRAGEVRYSVLSKDAASTQYTSYRLHEQTLTVIVEPHDVNEVDAGPPDFLGFDYRSNMRISDFFGPLKARGGGGRGSGGGGGVGEGSGGGGNVEEVTEVTSGYFK